MIEKFLEIVTQLAGIGERFATALNWVDTGFLAGGVLEELPTGSRRRPRAPSPRCSKSSRPFSPASAPTDRPETHGLDQHRPRLRTDPRQYTDPLRRRG